MLSLQLNKLIKKKRSKIKKNGQNKAIKPLTKTNNQTQQTHKEWDQNKIKIIMIIPTKA